MDPTKLATFSGTSGAVAVSGGVNANAGLAFKSTGYSLTGGTITLDGATAGDNTITTDPSVSATIASNISASNGFTKTGTGTLTVIGDVTGNATLSGGTLRIGEGGNTGSLAGNISTSGGTAVVFARGDDSTYGGVISGAAGLEKTGPGTLTLSGNNASYTGAFTISAGTVNATDANAFGTAAGGVSVATGATLNLAGVSIADALTLNGTGVGGNGALRVSAPGSGAGAVTLGSDTTIATDSGYGLTLGTVSGSGNALSVVNGGTTTLASVAIGTGTLNKTGGGTLAVTGASTTGAINVSSGSLTIGGATSAGTVSVTGGELTFNGATSTGTVSVAGGTNLTIGGTMTVTGVSGTGTIRGGASAGTFTVSKSAGNTSTFGGTLSDGASSLAIRHVGAGTTVLTGANSYSGGTSITDGTLEAHGNTALGSGGVTLTGGTLRASAGTTISNDLTVAATAGGLSFVSGYDFQTTANGGTALSAAPNTPKVITANFGTGTLYLDGTHGSNNFASTPSNPQLTAFSGTAVNTAGTSFSTSTSGASSLTLANSSANGYQAVFQVDGTSAYSGLNVSYATQGTSTGFSSQEWLYSTDGINFTSFATLSSVPSSFATSTFQTPVLSGSYDTLFLALKVAGSTNASGNNRLDNIQISGISAGAASVIGSVGSSGTTTYAGTISLAGNVNLDSSSGSTVAFTNVISSGTGSRTVTKTGTGKVTLSGPSTYHGSTVVSAGELRVNNGSNGSGTGDSKVTVASGATLGGNGTIGNGNSASNAVTISSGAKVTAGTDGNHAGTLTTGYQKWVGGPVATTANGTHAGGVYEWKYANEAGGTAWDKLQMSTLDLSDVSATNKFTILIKKLSGNFTAGSYTILTADHIIGLPASVADSFVLDTSGLNLGGGDQAATLMFVAGSGDGGSFVVQAAPEPTTAALFALGGAAFLGRRRRSNQETRTLFGFWRAKSGSLAN